MATLIQLKAAYLQHDQSSLENGWSNRWGGTHHQWRNTLYPRVGRFLPTDSVLEIGCGRGMLSQHIMRYTNAITLVDFVDTQPQRLLTTSELCRTTLSFYQNDGMTLNKVADGSIDFAFSFFSLVDANRETMQSYVSELDRVLTNDGVAFIHHSNALPEPGRCVDEGLWGQVRSVRAEDVNARVINTIASAFNLESRIQECVSWVPGCPLIDCFTTLVRPNNNEVPNVGQFTNRFFDDEVRYGISDLTSIYGQLQAADNTI